MHYNTELCQACRNHRACMVYWGESCKVHGGKKIPRIETHAPYHAWQRAEAEEQARQQAVRDQLDGNEVRRRPMWLPRLAKVVGR